MLQVRILEVQGQGLCESEGATGRSEKSVAGMARGLMTNGAEILGEQMGIGWVGANYRIRLRIWRGREGRGRNENLHGRRQACQASEEPMHDAALGNGRCAPLLQE